MAREILTGLYGDVVDIDALCHELLAEVSSAAAARRPSLRRLDMRREVDPLWFQSQEMIGYVAYADRFGGTLAGVGEHLDYLERLHVTYLHLMKVLHARAGANDGGYAVVDYTQVEPALGAMADLVDLADDLRARQISLCIDLVLNHTAREHQWAEAARAGSARHRDYYLVYPDRTTPDRYETSLPEVFPEMAPGNFTWDDDLQGWVWTTFNTYQWDLNYANPAVFVEMLKVMLLLANAGVEILRIDAVAFTWKRLGTACQNEPEAHLLAQAYRALLAIAAPAVILKAEAIVAPQQLVPYLGAHRQQRDECQLAYHNQLMVMLWSSLATGDARLATESLASLPATPASAGWVTYLRCHDDIGWAVDDEVAARVGLNGAQHRRFLAAHYRGDSPGSFACGVAFSSNPDTDDERTCGTAASLAGIERALITGDSVEVELGIRRLLLGYAVTFGFGGIPLIYMGDELALVNDWSFSTHAELRDDSRWVHRPSMPWAATALADPDAIGRRVLDSMSEMCGIRGRTRQLAGGAEVWMHRLENPALLAWERRHPRHGRFYGIANVSPVAQVAPAEALSWAGIGDPHELLGAGVVLRADGLHLEPLSVGWFVDRIDGGLQPVIVR